MALDQKKFYYFLAAVFAVHTALMAIKLRDQMKDISFATSAAQPIKIKLVQDALKQMASLQKRQIVQSEDSASDAKPESKAFLSDKDRTFDRQTIAKSVNTFQKAARGNASVSNPEQNGPDKVQKKKVVQDLKLSDFGVAASEAMPERSRAPASIKGIENGDLNSAGLSATNDYVEEVALGDFTHLNTVEYKHYGFFHRIRQKLEQFWGKTLHEKANNIFRSGRRLPASDSLITSLQVTLNTKGEIVGVKIMGSSGVRELDDAAIESFNEAGPFPNPPKDLLVNGKATIEWGFVVKS